MSETKSYTALSQLLDDLDTSCARHDGSTMGEVVEALGHSSFGPLMLIPALFIISPFSALVGFDSIMGVLIALVAVQKLFGRDHVWLPQTILKLKLSREKMAKGIRFLRPVARWTDKVVHPRLRRLAEAPFSRVIAAICVAIGISMPPLEVIPFSNTAGAAVVSFMSLGLTVRDGLLVAIALVLLLIALGFGAYHFLL
ncbi:exopolysaccharide biosynthesis protein [Mongoliimonas terrestris]|uniref:exopolysaccharide biosynthesis protein n=1 Tax=Mongoliimonas terrestris TaxID=1709001 RepID=UPI000949A339|nr:exopolysaccharide biosynthesis protein [Mongoliimonas terrestris]